MAANPPKIRIPPMAAGWFYQCRPVLNPPKGVFFTRINPLDPGDQMLSRKQLVDAGIETFARENWRATALIC
jgi:hypothetical protein